MVTVIRAVASLMLSRVEYILTSPWMVGAVVLLALSSVTVVVTGGTALTEHQQRFDLELQQRLKATLLSVGPNGRQVEPALRVIRPPTLAALLIPGDERSLPAAWDLGPATIEALPPYPATSPLMTFGGAADGATFVGQLGGVLALALGLATVLRDRRRGWGDAERGAGAPACAFVSAHLLAACLVLALAVGVWFFGISLALNRVEEHGWQDAHQTMLRLSALTWLHTVTLYGYGAAIGWHVHAPMRAVTATAILWLGLVLVGPQVTSSWLGPSEALSSRPRLEQDQRDTYNDRVREVEVELGRQIALSVGPARWNSEKEKRAVAAFQALEPIWIRGMADARAKALALQDDWRTQADRIAIRLQRVARLTPTMLLPQVLAEVSGTGSLTKRRWEDAVDDYRRRLDLALFDNRPSVPLRLPIDGSFELFLYVRHEVTPFRDLPQFVAPTITWADRWQASASDVLALLLHALMALTAAGIAQLRAWRRYDFASASAADVGRP